MPHPNPKSIHPVMEPRVPASLTWTTLPKGRGCRVFCHSRCRVLGTKRDRDLGRVSEGFWRGDAEVAGSEKREGIQENKLEHQLALGLCQLSVVAYGLRIRLK